MTTEKQKKEALTEGVELKDKEQKVQAQVTDPAGLLDQGLKGLEKLGGFSLIKGLVKDLDRLDPRKRAVRSSFLAESAYSESRKRMREELALWVSILEGGESDPMTIAEECEQKKAKAEKNLGDNLMNAHQELKQLETAYRSLDAFFANAGQGKIECITLININKTKLKDYNSEDTKALRSELEDHYDSLDLKKSYSLFVMPGYLGDGTAVREWAKTAYQNKVILVTDFDDCSDFGMLHENLDNASLQGQDVYFGNVIMTCNYLLGRKKSEIAGEDDDLFIPASGALAGRMSNVDEVMIAQGAAGRRYGTLDNIRGARIKMRKSEIASLIDMGVIPMVEEDGRTMAFSNRSLYNGATSGLQEYPIVRVFDWIGKMFQNFFNDEAFTNFNTRVKSDIERAIHDFLSAFKGPGKLFEDYNIKGVIQDPKTKDISVQVELKPFYAARNFIIELTGHKETVGASWDQDVKLK